MPVSQAASFAYSNFRRELLDRVLESWFVEKYVIKSERELGGAINEETRKHHQNKMIMNHGELPIAFINYIYINKQHL